MTRRDPVVRRAARELLAAYDTYLDTDELLQQLDAPIHRLREALDADVIVEPSTPEIEALAEEAERGYSLDQIKPREGTES